MVSKGKYEPKTDQQKLDAEEQIAGQHKRFDYYLTEWTVEILAQKLNSDEFYIPEYQRNFVWDENRKSRFIESLIMNLPIPFLFFWENVETGNLEVVDGSQRLRTILEFLEGRLVLGELDRLTELSGFTFGDLIPPRQRKIRNRSIRSIVLDEKADDQARSDLFDRINTGSLQANAAEIRRGALKGPYMNLVIQLSESKVLEKLAPISDRSANSRPREELVARFFTFSDGLKDYKDRVADFVYDHAKVMNEKFTNYPELREEYVGRSNQTMEFIRDNFPYGFARSKTGTATPLTRFEAISLGTYKALKTNPELNPDKAAIAAMVASNEFKAIVRADGANAIDKLRRRVDYVAVRPTSFSRKHFDMRHHLNACDRSIGGLQASPATSHLA